MVPAGSAIGAMDVLSGVANDGWIQAIMGRTVGASNDHGGNNIVNNVAKLRLFIGFQLQQRKM